jgi:2-polyprenyl-6-methoxyphenol hydroxylase-like FAD-dependent oxidoreductase
VEQLDALVIGGGPAGSAAATLLADAGWSVGLVERKTFPRRKVCGEYLSATNWPLLARLGVAEAFAERAGPPIRHTAIFVGSQAYRAPLPRLGDANAWGRALGRETLDTLLLAQAIDRGVCVWQPARCTGLQRQREGFTCLLARAGAAEALPVQARLVIAAHGSWEVGELPTERHTQQPRPSDWLAFKAHFRQVNMPPDLMPLLSFAGGYGGMVQCDGGRTSLSCCLRRARLERLPRRANQSAGERVLDHLLDSCPVLRPVLATAALEGTWLAAGAIRPGIRTRYQGGIFVVGNAAGEAHPVVAEGISMALQSAWLLADELIPRRGGLAGQRCLDEAGARYAARWRRAFAPRIRAAAAIAHWAARPRLVAACGPLISHFPGLLTLGARLAGKAHLLAPLSSSSPPQGWCEA